MSKVVIVSASNGKNLELSSKFETLLSQREIENEILDLVSLNLPLYTPLEESRGIPGLVLDQKNLFDSASGFVFVTPEYNGGLPPVLTNLIAWISRSGDDNWRSSFNSKPAALASFSGSGGIQALVSLRTQLSYIGLNTIGRQVRATYKEALNPDDVEAVTNLLIKNL